MNAGHCLQTSLICSQEDVVTVRKQFFLFCIILTVVIASSLCAHVTKADSHESNIYDGPSYKSSSPVGFNWILQRYDLSRVEEYLDEYYIDRYKHWEKYVVSKQREFAEKFGLTDIFLKPDFRNYEDSKVAFSKSLWEDKILLRYLAPVGDIRNFDMSVAFRPYDFVTFIMRGKMHGENRVALVINQPFGSQDKSCKETERIKKFLGKAKKLAN